MLMLSIILLAIWGYRNYFSGNREFSGKIEVISDSSLNARNNTPPASTKATDNPAASNEITTALLKEKLGELELLKAEITAILKTNSDSSTRTSDSLPSGIRVDSSAGAGQKVNPVRADSDVKSILDSLRHQNNKITSESNLLTKTVNKVKKDLKRLPPAQKRSNGKAPANSTTSTNAMDDTARRTIARNIVARKSTVVVSNLGMYALSRDRNLTTRARETAHIMVSFSLSSIGISSGELFIKIKRPDGQTIITGDSEYSLKIPFSSQQQKFNFFINTANLPKGLYKLEVYYHSDLIAQSSKTMI